MGEDASSEVLVTCTIIMGEDACSEVRCYVLTIIMGEDASSEVLVTCSPSSWVKTPPQRC